ncbi:radical SAM protein [bacterium]|nr:radical SAM protein [bacterium]
MHSYFKNELLEGVVISGGEPLLHGDCIDLVRLIKSYGFKVKLDTNGSFPDRLEQVLADGIDYIAMDVKAPLELYPAIVGRAIGSNDLQRSMTMVRASRIAYEFRVTLVDQLFQPNIVHGMGNLLKGASNVVLQPCSNAAFLTCGIEKIREFRDTLAGFVQSCRIRET